MPGKTISHVVLTLKTVKGSKSLRLDPTIYESLQKEKVNLGDVIYIEANSGAVKVRRVGHAPLCQRGMSLRLSTYVEDNRATQVTRQPGMCTASHLDFSVDARAQFRRPPFFQMDDTSLVFAMQPTGPFAVAACGAVRCVRPRGGPGGGGIRPPAQRWTHHPTLGCVLGGPPHVLDPPPKESPWDYQQTRKGLALISGGNVPWRLFCFHSKQSSCGQVFCVEVLPIGSQPNSLNILDTKPSAVGAPKAHIFSA